MFELVIDTRKISVRRREKITAGSVGIRIGFEFSSDWEGLSRTAVFETDRRKIAVVLTGNAVTLPWEVCEEAGLDVTVGVYGTNGDGGIVIPTVWAKLETVSPGADCSDAENSRTPTASDIQQISAAAASAVTAAGMAQLAAEKAEELAADVKSRADRGEFNGHDGINGLNGIDGTSVTITNISESAESGGTSVVTFSDGKTLSVKNGSDGQGGSGSDVTKETVREWGFTEDADLAAVAKSGNYNDLSNKPSIPAAVTESTVSGWGFTKFDGSYSSLSGKPTIPAAVTDQHIIDVINAAYPNAEGVGF